MKDEKEIPPGQVRFEARIYQAGHNQLWGVYDRQRGSWPGTLPSPAGKIKQKVSKEEAELEAVRLEELRKRQ